MGEYAKLLIDHVFQKREYIVAGPVEDKSGRSRIKQDEKNGCHHIELYFVTAAQPVGVDKG